MERINAGLLIPGHGEPVRDAPDESQAISPTAEPGRGGRRLTRGTPS